MLYLHAAVTHLRVAGLHEGLRLFVFGSYYLLCVIPW